MSKVLIVLSGGMDSATLLAHMIAEGHECAAITVHYGQRHRREIACAQALCAHYKVNHTIVDLAGLITVMAGSSQTDSAVDVPEGHYADENMKATVVPNRNMILLSVATAHAISIGYEMVAYGAHAGDHDIYPDCRERFVRQMRKAMALCHYEPILLTSPFQGNDKGDIAILGADLGVPYELTWTCYKGLELPCGKCGACVERIEAFEKCHAKLGYSDPLIYATDEEAKELVGAVWAGSKDDVAPEDETSTMVTDEYDLSALDYSEDLRPDPVVQEAEAKVDIGEWVCKCEEDDQASRSRTTSAPRVQGAFALSSP